ncbi:DUF2852 domain-containing protein [Thalassorhabdomicrobium marinisediminis]|uniref:DUF2852 domain-containing protein n=1 Tax=Thalassorhabdomicrobium marinisediminis TaxID=2170577 RepID=UPI00248FAE9A|nr:DUF2852 domain-containing protein [Thalassorhabdomicrobium marinisediminis]
MTTSSTIDYSAPDAQPVRGNWFRRAEGWLDDRGKGAWIAAMVLGFIFVWPVGLALLAYMIWSKRMFTGTCASKRTHTSTLRTTMRSSGNAAFDAYKAETLRRLEDEQHSFEEFLKRLREAKDKAEFDQFMEDRAARTESGAATSADRDGDDTRA